MTTLISITERDEAFWREQETRRQRLNQPCCTQSNMSWAMVDMEGDFAVVLHGESDCLNCFFHHRGRRTHDYYSTRLTDHQLTTGDTHRPLRRLLQMIAAERRPEAVIVLGTCPVEVIGDRFETVVEAVAAETGVPMVALHTHGLALMDQARCQDWLYATLAALGPRDEASPPADVQFLGLPPEADVSELASAFATVGLSVGTHFPAGASLTDWRRITRARKTFAIDASMYPQLSQVFEAAGASLLDLPAPIGVSATMTFYQRIAQALDLEPAFLERFEPIRARYAARVDALRERARGRRLALCVRMEKAYQPDKMAFEGTGPYALLHELGFDITLFVQGPPEPAARANYRERLDALGFTGVPLEVFLGPWKLGEALQEHRMEAALMSAVARNVVEPLGIRVIPNGALAPLFAGMDQNLALFESWLEP